LFSSPSHSVSLLFTESFPPPPDQVPTRHCLVRIATPVFGRPTTPPPSPGVNLVASGHFFCIEWQPRNFIFSFFFISWLRPTATRAGYSLSFSMDIIPGRTVPPPPPLSVPFLRSRGAGAHHLRATLFLRCLSPLHMRLDTCLVFLPFFVPAFGFFGTWTFLSPSLPVIQWRILSPPSFVGLEDLIGEGGGIPFAEYGLCFVAFGPAFFYVSSIPWRPPFLFPKDRPSVESVRPLQRNSPVPFFFLPPDLLLCHVDASLGNVFCFIRLCSPLLA